MAADVLLYNALNEFNRSMVNANAVLDTNIAAQNSLCTAAQNTITTNAPAIVANAGPNQANLWCLIPTLPATGCPWTAGLKVCDTSGCWNCGATCTWTVPAGVTCARFQLWGAGAGSGYGCCCAFTPFGGTGAYASVIIPVTVGDSYTICSGCAFCCFSCNSNYNSFFGRVPGCPSFVTGTGLCNFCANGGQGRIGNWMAAYGRLNMNRLGHVNYNSAGPCLCCMGSHYCFNNSCSTCGAIGYVPGAAYFGTTTSASCPSIVYGIRGMWPFICFDTNHHGYQCHPPIYGFESTSQCILTWSSTCCAGGFRAACNFLQFPGAGSYASTTMGGCTCSQCGDMGRMGMVCVTYC